MESNENRFRKSDVDIFNLQKMFSIKGPLQARSTLGYSETITSKKSINTSLSIQSSSAVIGSKPQKSAKTVSQKMQQISEKLSHAKKELNPGRLKNPIFINLNQRNSELNINIKNGGFVNLKFFPENKQHQNNQNETSIKGERQKMKLKMGKSKIEDFTNIEQKPKNCVKLPAQSNKNNKKRNYFTSELIRARDELNSLAIEHLHMSMHIMKQQEDILEEWRKSYKDSIFLAEHAELKGRKTLILDLDETLIHCSQNLQLQPDIVLDLIIANQQVHAQIILRPHVITFLKRIAKLWQVVIFTASYQQYADGILNQIDPDNKIFHHRLYRQHCTQVNQIYLKDLSRLNRDLGKLVLVDNSAYSYVLQPENAVPIFSYYDGNDSELSSLEHYLSILQKSSDVRQINKSYFKLHQYRKYDNPKQLIKQLYMQ